MSDEAFALLLLENNFNRWIDMGKTGNWLYSDVHPLYTSGGNVKQTPKPNNVVKSSSKKNFPNLGTNLSTPSTAKYQGWSNKGIKRFNYLFDQIETERSTTLSTRFEEEFLVYSVTHEESKTKSKKKKNMVYETCRHHLHSKGKSSLVSKYLNKPTESEESDSSVEDESSDDNDNQFVGYNIHAAQNN